MNASFTTAGLRWLVLVLLLAGLVPNLGLGQDDKPLTPEEKKQLQEVAAILDKVAGAAYAKGDRKQALRWLEGSLKIQEKLHKGQDHPFLAHSLNNMGLVLQSLGQADKALTFCERGLKMSERLYKDQDHPHLAISLNSMGSVLKALGQGDKALTYYDRALKMNERLYKGQDRPNLANSLNNMGFVLQNLGQADKALPFYDRALKMRERLYKDQDHPDLATSLNNMGSVLQSLGQADKALTFHERALKMRERLYKDQDHPDLAASLNNMGSVLDALGQADTPPPFHERALKMTERLYKDQDHPNLGFSLNNMGVVLSALGQADKALPFFDRALKMNERLYKGQDHPNLAISLNTMGSVLDALGQADKALTYCDRALKMRERLYKGQDHPDLATSLNNMGEVLQSLGQADKALTYYEQLFRVNTRILDREVAFAPEAQALERLNTLPNRRDVYLRLTRSERTEADRVAEHLWLGRAVVTRVLQRRHLGGPDTDEIHALRDKLATLRARLTAALLRPAKGPSREPLLREITEAKEKTERELLHLLPPRLRPGKDIKPDDLAALLPADAVYLDVLRYTDRDADRKRQPRYVAFVHGPRARTVRVDLGVARDIDAAANAWRELVLAFPKVSQKDRPAAAHATDKLAARLRELVWDKVAPSLPKETVTVYLSVEGDLGRFPFAALPDDQAETVLLERYAFVTVPHGPALVQRLRGKPGADDGKGTLLAVGGVDYGPLADGQAGYAPLPGTARERAQLEKMAGGRVTPALGGSDATTTRLLAELPKAAYAHLGTHGQFKADLFEQDRQATAKYQERLRTIEASGGLPARTGIGVRSPLGYVGLVLAGANTPGKAGPDGGVLSGEGIAGLQLEKLRLVVLSACETGLGANTDTEGVRGLQRAFHVAGCPAVVASLWSVDDEATAALMNAFWERVLTQKMEPERALREAQLLVLRRPDLVPLLATRGQGFGAIVRIDPRKEPELPMPTGGEKRSHPYLWSAFFLSAAGR